MLTLGGVGSTHVLATAVHAARLGAKTIAVRWRHDMHPAAQEVRSGRAAECAEVVTASNFVTAMSAAASACDSRGVPTTSRSAAATPLGTLGHVNAALELAEQIEAGELPPPARVVVPLGSGGTAAGLALGFAIAGLEHGRRRRARGAAHWGESLARASSGGANASADRAVYRSAAGAGAP